ncbi:unnamed protein product, partial [Heterosigma akashiwo]
QRPRGPVQRGGAQGAAARDDGVPRRAHGGRQAAGRQRGRLGLAQARGADLPLDDPLPAGPEGLGQRLPDRQAPVHLAVQGQVRHAVHPGRPPVPGEVRPAAAFLDELVRAPGVGRQGPGREAARAARVRPQGDLPPDLPRRRPAPAGGPRLHLRHEPGGPQPEPPGLGPEGAERGRLTERRAGRPAAA